MPENIQFYPALDRLDLLSPSIVILLRNWQIPIPVSQVLVAEINPAFAGGKDFCEHYAIPTHEGANCVIVEAIRGAQRTLAACVAPVHCRINFNGIVKKILNARRVSLAPLEEVLKETYMEYGSVTPIGLPAHWPILIDSKVANAERIVVGAGVVKAKLSIPGNLLACLPGVQVVEGLGI